MITLFRALLSPRYHPKVRTPLSPAIGILPATAPNSLNYGLVGHWDMEEGDGQMVKDKSGSGNDGTLGSSSATDVADPVFGQGHDSSGENGTGMLFDGVDDYVDSGDGTSLNITSALTLSAWIKFDDISTNFPVIVGKGKTWGNADTYVYTLAFNDSTKRILFDFGNGVTDNGAIYSTKNDFTTGTWYNITATWDGTTNTNGIKIYIDGVLDRQATSPISSIQTLAQNVAIGRDLIRTASTYNFNGSMDEVRIYNRALSEDEVRLLYNQKKPILNLKMDEGSGTTLYDDSFNNRDAKIYNKINTAISATANTLTDNDVNWVVNYWTGQQVSIIYGTGVGQTRTISSNTDTVLTVSQNCTVTPDNTSRYAMTLPGSNWTERNSNPAVSLADVGYAGFATPDNAPISGTMPFTLEAWIKTSSASGYIMQQRDLGGVAGEYIFEISNGKARYWDYAGSIAHNLYSSQTVNDGAWHHIVFTRNGRIGTMYVDGVVGGTSDVTAVNITSTLDFAVGCDFRDAQGYFNGSIDDVRVYNYARTIDEVKADYNEGLAADLGKNNQNLNEGLIGYWDMEEGQGQIVYDKSGNNNDCTLGATSSVGNDDPIFAAGHDATGINGTGMKFDGINDYLNCGNSSSLDTTQAITTSVWFYTDRIPASYFGLVGEQYTDSNGSYQLYLGGSNQIIWATALDPDTRIRTVGIKSFVGAWHNVTSTFSLEEQLQKIYVDGIKIIEESRTVPLELSTQSLKIGGQSLSMGTIDGYIDEVRIYNRALSDDETRYLYNQKKPALHLKLDEGSGNIVHDESFSSHDSTLGDGTCAAGSGTCPSWANGKFAGALSFDGSNDYVPLAQEMFKGLSSGSISTWFKTSDTAGAILDQYYLSGAYSYKFNISDGKIKACFGTSVSGNCSIDAFDVSSGMNVNDNNWHFASAVYTGSDVILYVDGVERDRIAKTGNMNYASVYGNILGSQGYIYLGSLTAQGDGYLNGLIDDLRIYDYVRTADEILTDYNDGQAAHLGKNNQDLNQGLVGWWDFEEGQGQTLKDKSGNGNDCTLGSSSSPDSADPIFASGFNSSGARGTGIKFDAINDYGNLGNGSSLTSNSGFTYSFWMKRSGSDRGGYGGLVEYLNRGDQNSRMLIYDASSQIIVQDSGGTKLTSTTVFAQDTFYHITLTWDGSLPRLYVNGILDVTGIASNFTAATANNIKIGIGADWSPTYYLNGIMDEVRIYNRALSVDEIRMLYNQKKPVLNLKMDEGSGTSVKDESFNDNDGTLGDGTCQPGAGTCPSWIQGKFGAALNIDGSDDYISIPSSASVSPSKYITVEAWVKYGGYVHQWSPIVWKNNSYQMDLWTNGATPHFGVAGGEATARESLPVGVWTHLTGTYDGSNVRLYVNGIEVASSARTGSITVNSNPVYSGAVSGLVWRYRGGIDDIRIYDYARSTSEVLADYNAGQAAHLR